jgi:AcrR family transcriptional regulator
MKRMVVMGDDAVLSEEIVDVRAGRERIAATREALLSAAERLFAERGIHAVANRHISEAAGQGNNAAVSYHFGTKADVVRAIVRRHAEQIEEIRARLLAEIGDPADLRDWVACAVLPITEHLDALGSPSWYARFIAQVAADPSLRAITDEQAPVTAPSMHALQEGMNRCLPGLPAKLYEQRAAMTRHLITQMSVDSERALAGNASTTPAKWGEVAIGLIDAIVALWQAPVTCEPGPAVGPHRPYGQSDAMPHQSHMPPPHLS